MKPKNSLRLLLLSLLLSFQAYAQQTPSTISFVDIPLSDDQIIINTLIEKGYLNAVQGDRFYPDRPLSRGEYITLLFRATGQKNPFLSEFPYYSDLPTTHWAYPAIEAFRMRGWLANMADEWVRPDEPITRLDAAVLLSRTLDTNWLKLNNQEVSDTLKPFAVPVDSLPPWARFHTARSVYIGFLEPNVHPENRAHPLSLDLEQPLTRLAGVRLVNHRMRLAQGGNDNTEYHIRMLPAGLQLTLTPTTAMPLQQLETGQSVYFALADNVMISNTQMLLPRGTRFHGVIFQTDMDKKTVVVTVDRANLPAGDVYNVSGQLLMTLVTNEKERQPVFLPGDMFQFDTKS